MGDTKDITGVILAGGAGSRLGGQDKGLTMWRGSRLVEHVYDRLLPQVDNILISCNRNQESYGELAPTVSDSRRGYQGPLAGIEAAALKATGRILIVVACDTPLLPLDLVCRLTPPLLERPRKNDIAFAHDGTRAQYLFAALYRDRLESLSSYLDEGQRAVRHWMATRNTTSVDFSDQANAFTNMNYEQSVG